MSTVYQALTDALAHQQAGRFDEAERLYRQILAVAPQQADAWHLWGMVAYQQHDYQTAVERIRQAVAVAPTSAMYLANLGLALRMARQLPEALDVLERAVAVAPDHAVAHAELGIVYRALGRFDEAIAAYQQALRFKPGNPITYNNLGAACQECGRLLEAVGYFQKSLALKPDSAMTHANLGVTYKSLRRFAEAAEELQTALRLDPHSAEAHNNLGSVYWELGRFHEALAEFAAALRIRPLAGVRIRHDLALPMVPRSVADLEAERARFTANLTQLEHEPLHVDDPLAEVGMTSFYLAYHGQNDRPLQEALCRLYRRVAPSLSFVAPHSQPGTRQATDLDGRPLRIGFLSRFFYDHPIGQHYAGLVAGLDRREFEVTFFRFSAKQDAVTDQVLARADRTLMLSARLAVARQQIAELELDVLVYADLGLDPLSYYLAFARLAPVQAVLPGHPVTTGIDTVDYYFSSVDLEPPDADEHYSERLVRLRHHPSYFHRPPEPEPATREEFGLPVDRRLYVCTQTLFKIHPAFDELLGQILRADPAGEVVLFEYIEPHGTQLVRERLTRTIPDVMDRVRFLPRLTLPQFRQVLTLADVLLDTPHFSGGTTTFEGLAVGAPIVTWPGAFARGRQTLAAYRRLGITRGIADSAEAYVAEALRVAQDPEYRAAFRREILDGRHLLYENPAVVAELAAFFQQAAREAAR